MEKIIIAAVSKNNVIGRDGKIPWHLKEELIHFKNSTTGFPVIMGRKTWNSLNKPLENRLNIIITRKTDFSFSHSNVVICNSISEALLYCEDKNFQKVFIIGGQEIFEESLTFADKMILSEIKIKVDGNRFFPFVDWEKWELKSSVDKIDFVIKEYIRKK